MYASSYTVVAYAICDKIYLYFYFVVLMVRYCRHYPIVTYDLCGLLVLHGISGRAFAAI